MNNINYINAIHNLKIEKNAILLCHYYQTPDIQEIADVLGDSLALAQEASKTNADIIVMAGVKFMAETAKIINPSKKVLLPDLEAGCSLADSCPPDEFLKFKKQYPDHMIISYVNTSVEIKALSDILCTSSNAIQIINSLPSDQKIIFAPDKNLGNYINSVSGRNMKVWNGACHVHEQFSLEKILNLKKSNPDAKIIAHPECARPVLLVADFIGSTSSLLNFTKKDILIKYIVATESGILHEMRKNNPGKLFIPAPPNDSTCACNDCAFMKKITLKKIYDCLLNEVPEVIINEDLRLEAVKPLKRMLDISAQIGI